MFSAKEKNNNLSNYKHVIYFKDTLYIKTYIVGYKKQGEAVLFFVLTDNKISFSGLVDCFKTKELNYVEKILVDNKIEKLNFICWTHPDFDHSNGLRDIIQKYVSKETDIWIPEGIDSKEITCSNEVRKLFEELRRDVVNFDTDYNVYSASDKKDLLAYNSVCFVKDIDSYPLEMNSYAPNSKIIRKQHYLDRFIKNDRSIFLVIALGDTRIYLTGDIEDETIERIPSNFLKEHIHIMKIPHHGSDTSLGALNFGDGQCDVACSTVYRVGKSKLPLNDVMNLYISNSKGVYCTGNKDETQEESDYGVIEIVTNVVDNKYSINVEGNAILWEKGEDDKS